MEDYTQNGEFSVTENVDNLTSEINVVNNLSSNLESPENIVSEVNSNDSMDSMLSDAEQINSELDLPTSEKYVGGDTDSISVIVDNSNNKITATIKQIKFKTAFDFPPAGSSKLLYVAEDEKAIYYWDSELAIYVKASGGASEDSGYDDTEIRSKIKNLEDNKAEKTDLDNYYTKSQTYTKQEVDIAISNVEVDLSGYYTKTETDNVATQTLNSAKGYTDTKVAELIDSAPETLDTFKEIADAFAEDQEVLDTLNSAIGLKADKAELSSYATKTELNTGLDEKVDKVTGKGLSTNDYTTDEKNKLASLKNYDDTSVKADITALQQNKADKTELSNYVTNTALESKGYLTEIPSEYVTEAELETKNYATKTELSNGLNNKVDKVEGKGLSTNDLTDDLLGKINNNTVIEITESSVHIKDLGSGIYKLPMGCTFSFYATNKFTAPSESYLFVTETNEGRREFYILCSDYYAQTGIGNKYLISGYAYIPSAVGYSYKFVINKDYVDTSTDQSEIYGIKTFKKPVKMTEELSQNVIDDDTLVTAKWTKDKLDTKQDKLDAGTGITIEGNRISASLGDGAQIIKLPSPVHIYNLDSGVYQLPAGCELYYNNSYASGEEHYYRINYVNEAETILFVQTTEYYATQKSDRKLFVLFAENDSYGKRGSEGSFIVGVATATGGSNHIAGIDTSIYIPREGDALVYGTKTFQSPTKYSSTVSLATTLNDKTLVDAQWVKSQGYLNDSELANKGYITEIPSEYVTETELTSKGYATQSSLNSTNSNVSSIASNVSSLNTNVNSLSSSVNTNTYNISSLSSTVSSLSSNKLNTSDLFNKIYPVGSIYLTVGTGTTGTNSPASFFGGSWTRIGEGYALWTASSGAGNTISAGLPNIKGNLGDGYCCGINTGASTSALYTSGQQSGPGGTAWTMSKLYFNASRSSGIYKDTVSTVQPPAYKVYAWRRTS